MPYTPKTDWKVDDEVDHDHLNTLEQALADATAAAATTKAYVDTAVDSAKTPAGTREHLDAGTDTTVRAFSAKDINDYVAAKIAELAEPKA